MNAFAKFGIDHLSPSSLNKWRQEPRNWGRYYLKGEREDGPFFWRGNAIEAGLKLMLNGYSVDPAIAEGLRIFEQSALGQIDQEIDLERKLIGPLIKNASKWEPPSELNATQLRIELNLSAVPIPIIGYIDFAFDGIDVDCKTAKNSISQPSWEHVRQVSIYRAARKRRGAVLHLSRTGHKFFEIDDAAVELAIESVEADAIALEKQLGRATDADDFIAALPDFERFEKRKPSGGSDVIHSNTNT